MRILVITLYGAIFFALIIGYRYYIEPQFSYMGFDWFPNENKMFAGVLLTLFLASVLPTSYGKTSDVLIHLHSMFPVLPMIVLYGVMDQSSIYLSATLICLGIVYALSQVRLPSVHFARIDPLRLTQILVATSWGIIGLIVALGGMRYLNFDLQLVYEFRQDAGENLPGIFAYFTAIIAKVFLPASLVLAFAQKNLKLVVLSAIGSILIFGLTANKGTLIYPIAALMLFSLSGPRSTIPLFLIGSLILIITSMASFSLGGSSEIFGNMALRRSFLVPALLNFQYYDFFSQFGYVFWAESKITFGLIESPYLLSIPNLIGWTYSSNVHAHANTGWFGSGFANAGFTGMLVYAIIVGLLFALVDSYSKSIDRRIVLAVSAGPLLTLMTSSDLPTAFLNHGIISFLLICACLSPNTGVKEHAKPRNTNTAIRPEDLPDTLDQSDTRGFPSTNNLG